MRLLAAALCGIASLPAAFLPAGDRPLTEVAISGAPLGFLLETRAGRPFDRAALQRDVRALWSTGRYSDIQVRFNDERSGLYFDLEPQPRYRLRNVLFEPQSEARALDIEPGAEVDQARAQRMAAEIRRGLESRGFRDARVTASLLPDGLEADVLLHVEPGHKVRVSKVTVDGSRSAKALQPLTLLPGLRLSKAFTQERLDEDRRRLQASLLTAGYFDAQVRPVVEPVKPGRLHVHFEVDPGPQYSATLDGFCPNLLSERAAAEREGRLDFSAEIEVRTLGAPRATASYHAEAGEPYRIRWINLEGAPSFRDRTLRRALKLEEGGLLNQALLRQSLARLSRFSSLAPVTERNAVVTEAAPGVADLTIRLKQSDPRRWTVGGPLGPMSLFGPIHGKLETRLPAWGRGLLELSTYTVGGWLTSVPELVFQNNAWVWKTIWKPSLVLSRPALPGQSWTSGYLWSPQLSWKQTIAANGALRIRSHLGSLLDGPPPEPALRVPVRHAERGIIGEIACEQGRSWTDHLRTTAKLALAVAGL
jgi:hypothetical protein